MRLARALLLVAAAALATGAGGKTVGDIMDRLGLLEAVGGIVRHAG